MMNVYDPLGDKTIEFAVRIVKLGQILIKEKNEQVIRKQLIRSGTNPGAMIREARNAESGLDFIHKLGIAQKEIGESIYWLEVLVKTEYISLTEYTSLTEDANEIMKIIRSSIITKKKNMQLSK